EFRHSRTLIGLPMNLSNSLLLADDTTTYLIMGLIVVLVILAFLGFFARYLSLWIQCKVTRAGIGFMHLVMMSIRRVTPTVIVRSKIMAVQAGLTKGYPIR